MFKCKNILIHICSALSFFSIAAEASQWFCKEGASSKNDNTYEVCGIGQDFSENESRKIALKNAFEEFDLVCNRSDDCKGKYKKIFPLRTDCEIIDEKYKCYRSFNIAVNPLKNSANLNHEFLIKQQEKKENQHKYMLANNKNILNELNNVEKLSYEIRDKIKAKNEIVESYLKRGMNLREVFQILNTSADTSKYSTLDGEDYLIYGTYKIHFNRQESLEIGSILEAACDMNNSNHCINIEP
ncbi:MAG: hypothetical protein V4591_04280 [Bdellovibrionota bacterium]